MRGRSSPTRPQRGHCRTSCEAAPRPGAVPGGAPPAPSRQGEAPRMPNGFPSEEKHQVRQELQMACSSTQGCTLLQVAPLPAHRSVSRPFIKLTDSPSCTQSPSLVRRFPDKWGFFYIPCKIHLTRRMSLHSLHISGLSFSLT